MTRSGKGAEMGVEQFGMGMAIEGRVKCFDQYFWKEAKDIFKRVRWEGL